eukprot:12912761-Prorocentrum_lima.AAC.1
MLLWDERSAVAQAAPSQVEGGLAGANGLSHKLRGQASAERQCRRIPNALGHCQRTGEPRAIDTNNSIQ